MSAPTRLYFDKWNKALVAGVFSTNAIAFERLFYGSTKTYHIYILEPSDTPYPNPYSVTSVANRTLKFALTATIGTGSITLLAGQNTWTQSADNSYLYADVTFSSADLKTALDAATSADYINAYLEVAFDEGGLIDQIYQSLVRVYKRAIDPTSVVPVAPDVPLSLAEGVNRFVPQDEPTGYFRIRTSESGFKFREWFGDDGQPHWERIL